MYINKQGCGHFAAFFTARGGVIKWLRAVKINRLRLETDYSLGTALAPRLSPLFSLRQGSVKCLEIPTGNSQRKCKASAGSSLLNWRVSLNDDALLLPLGAGVREFLSTSTECLMFLLEWVNWVPERVRIK